MTDTPRDREPGFAPSSGLPAAGAGWGWILAYGILSVTLGVAAFVWPFAATWAATLVIGSFLAAAGALSVGAGLFGRGHEGRGYAIAFGLLSLLVGLLMIFQPIAGALSLTLMVGAWLVARGVLEIMWGARMRRGPRKSGAAMIALGVVNLLLAVFVFWTLPWSALTLPGFILGISFLFGGIASIASAMAHRKGDPAFAVQVERRTGIS